jgi:hypothetical protein
LLFLSPVLFFYAFVFIAVKEVFKPTISLKLNKRYLLYAFGTIAYILGFLNMIVSFSPLNGPLRLIDTVLIGTLIGPLFFKPPRALRGLIIILGFIQFLMAISLFFSPTGSLQNILEKSGTEILGYSRAWLGP